MRIPSRITVAVGCVALAASAASAVATTERSIPDSRIDCVSTLSAPDRQQAFERAGAASGVPQDLLLAVSYLESRWDDHGTSPSVAGGFGPMHLVDSAARGWDARGDEARGTSVTDGTLQRAAELTGLSESRLTSDPNANICGAAAVLASYAPDDGAGLASWSSAVERYGSDGTSEFARQVYATLRDGARRTTNDGERVGVRAHPGVRLPSPRREAKAKVDCPDALGCEWIPAPYELADGETDPGSSNYGAHDKAHRPKAPKLSYIVIHDTEATYDQSVDIVQDTSSGTSWNYTIRSSDGHIAQHLKPKDVGWQAGNWYINAHSIGIEHEGKAGNGSWYTEALYRQSAQLVRYLTRKYDIPRDRGHILGHDTVPGTIPGATESMHWDPGPYWDWEHYFDLLGAPIGGERANQRSAAIEPGDTVTVRPGFDGNTNEVTDCEEQSPGSGPCDPDAGTNFVYLRQAHSGDAPLARDAGWNPGANESSTVANDIGARAAAGTQLVVNKVDGDWLQVSWAGNLVWLHNPAADPAVSRVAAPTVTVKEGRAYARTYGRAYPERSAYPDTIPYQEVQPIEYVLRQGQEYVIANPKVATDYYYAMSFDGSLPDDRTVVSGKRKYYLVWTGHRQTFVPASDVVTHGLGR
ncbi:N-acetylmuramoyl-L-alanine amidase [Solicola gregarius]|uniref:N-acetylmuramoyl-L-alanine amidase n=1 Tax=Solicola gregarius TaxID=2908642 RepID=A0AA46THK5_9ACTN|nr:N-acetylmuramoyl-L-alanine amidase [Solicola gregarius]UYM05301.1 N-acetylmuramoyl-L-alanine amidase [Solicola gregarius]